MFVILSVATDLQHGLTILDILDSASQNA